MRKSAIVLVIGAILSISAIVMHPAAVHADPGGNDCTSCK